MKKSVILAIALVLLSPVLVMAECDFDASMINQDPYPASPGDYVKLVFQVTGVEDPTCGTITFELLERYPIIFDNANDSKIEIQAGTYADGYSPYLVVPYKVRLDKNAIDGENEIEVRFGRKGVGLISKKFNIEVENSIADFEVHIDDYSFVSKELTLEILNIADHDVEALTIEIPKQEKIGVIGTNRVVVGDLDSNEYTTADFKASLSEGEIDVKILYTDQAGVRREIMKKIDFDPAYFAVAEKNITTGSIILIVIGIIVILLIILWSLKKRKNKRKRRRDGVRLR